MDSDDTLGLSGTKPQYIRDQLAAVNGLWEDFKTLVAYAAQYDTRDNLEDLSDSLRDIKESVRREALVSLSATVKKMRDFAHQIDTQIEGIRETIQRTHQEQQTQQRCGGRQERVRRQRVPPTVIGRSSEAVFTPKPSS